VGGGNKCRVASVAEAAASVSSRTLIDISRVKLSPPTVSAGHKASVVQLGIFFPVEQNSDSGRRRPPEADDFVKIMYRILATR